VFSLFVRTYYDLVRPLIKPLSALFIDRRIGHSTDSFHNYAVVGLEEHITTASTKDVELSEENVEYKTLFSGKAF
jgi:hypothetical protein